MITCPKCGHTQNPEDAKFCGKCGGKLTPPVTDVNVATAVSAAVEKLKGAATAPQVWRELNDRFHGDETPALVDAFKRPSATPVKIKLIEILSVAMRSSAGKVHAYRVLTALCDSLTDSNVRSTIVQSIAQAPIPRDEKWQYLMSALKRVPPVDAWQVTSALSETTPQEKRGVTVRTLIEVLKQVAPNDAFRLFDSLAKVTPPEDRAMTGQTIVDTMRLATAHMTIVMGIHALRQLDYQQHLDALAEILPTVVDEAKASLADFVTQDDRKQYAPAVRQALENARFGNCMTYGNPNLPSILYRLEGNECAEYLADVLRMATSSSQRAFLLNNKNDPMLKEPPIATVIRDLRTNPPTPEVQKAAEAVPG